MLEASMPVDLWEQDSYEQSVDVLHVPGGWMRAGIGAVLVLFALVAFATDISQGYYPIKLFALACIALMVFRPQNYPFLLGLAVPTYFELKMSQTGAPETSYMVQFAYVFAILMAVGTFVRNLTTADRTRRRIDVASVCLIGLVLIALMGFGRGGAGNFHLFVRRLLEITGFACVFYVGRCYVRTLAGLRLLLLGLFFGLIAFVLPWTVGFVLREGVGVLGELHRMRGEIGTASAATESGIVAVAFAFAYAVSGCDFPRKVRRMALWFVAVPAVLGILVYLSRAALAIIPISVVLTLFVSGRRRAAIWTLIVGIVLGAIFYSLWAGLSVSVEERVQTTGEALTMREEIWRLGWKSGIENPWIGLGAGQFRYKWDWFHAHNDTMTLFAEHGLLAVVFYWGFWAYLAFVTLRLLRSGDSLMRNFGASFAVLMVCYLMYSQIEPMYFNRGGLLFAFLGGIATKLYHERQGRESEPEVGYDWADEAEQL